jgi:hypothetical protein
VVKSDTKLPRDVPCRRTAIKNKPGSEGGRELLFDDGSVDARQVEHRQIETVKVGQWQPIGAMSGRALAISAGAGALSRLKLGEQF